MLKKLFISLLTVATLLGCTDIHNNTVSESAVIQEEIPNESTLQDIQYEVPQETRKNIEACEFAIKDYLLPLEDYSWERTEKAEYVMLHFTSGVVLSKENPYDLSLVRKIFLDNSLSINYIIDRDGNIYCWMPETRAAWHAGKGSFDGIDKLTNSMNKYSIGIEMLAIGSVNDMSQYLTRKEYEALENDYIGYTDKQYESLKRLVSDICSRNDIPFDEKHVIGHDMYNNSKTDPGELFEYSRLFS